MTAAADTAAGTPTPYPVAARELRRDVLFDAARQELRSRPWAQVTMADIARAAGVSRQTVYNEFGSRQAFAEAFVLREADRFLSAVEGAISEHADDPAAALAAAFDVFLTAAGEDPFVRAVVERDADADLLALVTTRGQPVVEFAAERLSAVIARHWPGVPQAEAGLLAETVVRLAISHAALPSGSAGMTAARVAELLSPYIERVLADAGIDA